MLSSPAEFQYREKHFKSIHLKKFLVIYDSVYFFLSLSAIVYLFISYSTHGAGKIFNFWILPSSVVLIWHKDLNEMH